MPGFHVQHRSSWAARVSILGGLRVTGMPAPYSIGRRSARNQPGARSRHCKSNAGNILPLGKICGRQARRRVVANRAIIG